MDQIVVTAVLKPKPDMINPLLDELEKVKVASREESGCLQYDLLQAIEDDTVLIYEVYENSDAVQNHIKTEHYQAYRENTADIIQSREVYKMKKV